MHFIDYICYTSCFSKNCSHISNPKINRHNLLMLSITKSLKNTVRLIRNVLYVAKKVFLLM
jgi:hypothetical protein